MAFRTTPLRTPSHTHTCVYTHTDMLRMFQEPQFLKNKLVLKIWLLCWIPNLLKTTEIIIDGMMKSVAGLQLLWDQNHRGGRIWTLVQEAGSGGPKGIVKAYTSHMMTQRVPQATWPRPLFPRSQDNIGEETERP